MALIEAPLGTCDSHVHVYDRTYPSLQPVPEQAGVADYRRVSRQLGASRVVMVQPRPYGVDNNVMLAAIRDFGPEKARGVAVVHPDVGEAELLRLHQGGVRGVRFSLFTSANVVVSIDMVEAIARRVSRFGWHLQLHWTADQIWEHRLLLQRLSVPLVFDHMARLPTAAGTSHPAFDLVRGLLEDGRADVKLSGPYLDSELGLAATYADVAPVAEAWVAAAPKRLVWGSDWPHASERTNVPAATDLLALLGDWVTDPTLRQLILVDNPARLYDFPGESLPDVTADDGHSALVADK